MRDIYYRDDVLIEVPRLVNGEREHKEAKLYAGRPGWATRDNPMLLRSGRVLHAGR